MKAMMSKRLRNILNDPDSARELQKQLSASHVSSKLEKCEAPEDQKSLFSKLMNKPNNDRTPKSK